MKKTNTKNLALAFFDMTDGKSEAEISLALKVFAKYLREKNLLKKADEIISEYIRI